MADGEKSFYAMDTNNKSISVYWSSSTRDAASQYDGDCRGAITSKDDDLVNVRQCNVLPVTSTA